jgi:hypothetical protein
VGVVIPAVTVTTFAEWLLMCIIYFKNMWLENNEADWFFLNDRT